MTDAAAKSAWDERYAKRAMISPLDFTEKAWGYVQIFPHPRILDVGCGDGRDSLFFADRGCDVTAIDFSVEAIKRASRLHPEIDARVLDITAMDFPDASFDAVYAHLALHYFDDATTDGIFANIHRMLRSEGFFFVKCKSMKDPLYGKGEKVGEDMFCLEYVRHFFSEEYMREKLQNFTILTIESTEGTYDGRTSAFIEAVATK